MTSLVLASGSPRRRQILSALGLDFDVRPPDTEERFEPAEPVDAAAVRLACEKAAAVSADAHELVLAADTIVALDDELLAKPEDASDAVRMLRRLAGRSHDVVTGIALRHAGSVHAAAATTRVMFRPLSDEEIGAYVATGEPLDKAGAYGIQGFGSALVEGIEGDFYNVMGLPVPALLDLLPAAGFRYLPGRLLRVAEVAR